MLFRGTDRYGSLEIDQIFDTMGAELNAGTGKETTSVYARVIDEHLPQAFDVVGDMVWHPRIDEEDLANEREIVLEEIAMYEDDPQDRVFDVLGEAVFGDHPLGRPVIGRADVIADTQRRRPARLPRRATTRRATSSSRPPARWITTRSSSSRAASTCRGGPRAPQPPPVPEQLPPHLRFLKKDTEQYHITLGAPALARDDERRFILRVLDNILGGTSSSRLFQEVRELRGLAYNVYSFQSLNAGTGLIGVYLGTRPDNVAPALQVVADELERLREDGVTPEELERSKENVKGRIVLSLESTASRMSRLGSAVLSELPLLSLDEVVERIESVTLDELNGLLRELLAPERLSAAAVGADEDVFRVAIEPVAPELLAAASPR